MIRLQFYIRIYHIFECSLFQFHFITFYHMQETILNKLHLYDSKTKNILDKALAFSNLKVGKQIDYRSVKINQKDHLHEIYTMNQNSNLPHIVLIHGFGGTSLTYFRLFKFLFPFYKVHALDSIGVGHSSKGIFDENFDYFRARQYYINAIQQWRSALNIQSFTLMGHSFGGYLAACYTEAHPNRVNRLILLSPAGVTQEASQQGERQKGASKQRLGSKQFQNNQSNIGFRPSKMMSSAFLNKMIDQRLNLCGEEEQISKMYYKDLIDKEAVGEKGFFNIFEWPLRTKYSIQRMITKLNFSNPVQFYYGQSDWMDSVGAIRMAKKYKNIHFDRISSAGHQLIFENPLELSEKILKKMTAGELQNRGEQHRQ